MFCSNDFLPSPLVINAYCWMNFLMCFEYFTLFFFLFFSLNDLSSSLHFSQPSQARSLPPSLITSTAGHSLSSAGREWRVVEGAGEVKRESRQGNSSPRGARRALHASASSRKRHSAAVGPEAECRLTPMSRPLRSSPLALLSPSLMSAPGLSLFSRLSLLSTRRQPPLIFLSSEYERNIKRGRLGGGLFA